jgi:hypothetical protein
VVDAYCSISASVAGFEYRSQLVAAVLPMGAELGEYRIARSS